MQERGILLPIFSLPSTHGIGTLGKAAYDFIDLLHKNNQKYWQILPIHPTNFGNSPYSSTSSKAGNMFFIDLDMLVEEKLLDKIDVDCLDEKNPNKVDYDYLYKTRLPLLKKVAAKLFDKKDKGLYDFIDKNATMLYEYATYEVYSKNLSIEDLNLYKAIQYLFCKQYDKLKKYANEKNVKIFGDVPIYQSYNSEEVFFHKKLFMLDEKKLPIAVAGCPPDGFSVDGQVWNNPLYDFEYIEENNFDYFIDKYNYLSKFYDVMRLDHFRGFASFFAIPYGDKNAKNGKWVKGPGMKLFNEVKKKCKNVEFVAEDLGHLDDDVNKLLKDSGFPGMRVLEFAFDEMDKKDNMYLVENYKENTVAYLGTHDNDTWCGFINSLDKKKRNRIFEYIGVKDEKKHYIDAIKRIYNSKSQIAIIQLQDFLGKGSEARINTPSTVNDNNWSYRVIKEDMDLLKGDGGFDFF